MSLQKELAGKFCRVYPDLSGDEIRLAFEGKEILIYTYAQK